MKIQVDENIPKLTVNTLITQGHDVTDIRQTSLQGLSDDKLWEKIQRENRLLITTDKGFAQYRNQPHNGILIIRLRQPNLQKIHDRVLKAISQFKVGKWKNRLVIMRDAFQSTWVFQSSRPND